MSKSLSTTSLRLTTSPDGHILYDATYLARPNDAWFQPASYLSAQPVDDGGRGAAWFVVLESWQAVLRHYRRGGLIARFNRDRYFWTGTDNTRSFGEFRVLAHLYASGCPVPRPLAAAWWRQRLGYRAAIIVERLPEVLSLARYVQHPVNHAPETVAQSVVKAVRAMHQANIWHADLNAHNILIDKTGGAWLIDFDRARSGVVSQRQRQRNMLRLRRSLIKVAGQQGHNFYDLVTT